MAIGSVTPRTLLLIVLLATAGVFCLTPWSGGQSAAPVPLPTALPQPLLFNTPGSMSDADIRVAFERVAAGQAASQKDITEIKETLKGTLSKLQEDVRSLEIWRAGSLGAIAALQIALAIWLKMSGGGRSPSNGSRSSVPQGEPVVPAKRNLFFGR